MSQSGRELEHRVGSSPGSKLRLWLGLSCIATLSVCSCKSGSDNGGNPPPAAATATNMPLPGIGIEVEEGEVFYGTYEAATGTVNITGVIRGDSLYASEPAPHTSVPGFDVTVDIGSESRTLELVTGPWGATYASQTRALEWVSAFYAAIKAASQDEGAVSIDRSVYQGRSESWEGFDCARLSAAVEKFVATTELELAETAQEQAGEGEFYVCLDEDPQDFAPQANYGVKLRAFLDGAIARDFDGWPGRTVTDAEGDEGTLGPGCELTAEMVAALRESVTESVDPSDANAICQAQAPFDSAGCGAPHEQPSFACLPGCLMGQLCYGLATNKIWKDGAARSAREVLCAEEDSDACQAAALLNSTVNVPSTYASTAVESEESEWSLDEQLAIMSLLVFNRCATWINSFSTADSGGCAQSFWKKQMMGVLPKARFDQFKPHLPESFASAGGGGEDPPLTTLATYQSQVCENSLILGESARAACKAYVSGQGLDGFIGGKPVALFRIDGDLSLVVESRFDDLYVAGGYRGVTQADGAVAFSAEALRASINFVRTINGFEPE